jgi:hypothetical protein
MKQADRPDSVTANRTSPFAMTAIPLGRELLHGSSFLPARSASNINACLFGIAPDGGYRVSPFVTQGAAFALPGPKDSSLWPYSAPRGGRPLAVILLYGVRTFLPSSLQPKLQRRPAAVWLASTDIVAHYATDSVTCSAISYAPAPAVSSAARYGSVWFYLKTITLCLRHVPAAR